MFTGEGAHVYDDVDMDNNRVVLALRKALRDGPLILSIAQISALAGNYSKGSTWTMVQKMRAARSTT